MLQIINFLNALYAKFTLTMKDKKGQGLVEYALILVLIAIVVIAALTGLGNKTSSTFSTVDSHLSGS